MPVRDLPTGRLLDGLDNSRSRHDAAARGVEEFHAVVVAFVTVSAAMLDCRGGVIGEPFEGADALEALDELYRRAAHVVAGMSPPLRGALLEGLDAFRVGAAQALFALGRVR